MSLEESSTFQANRIKVILVGNQSVGKTNLKIYQLVKHLIHIH